MQQDKTKNLLILPFDHRSSFSKKILQIKGEPDEKQTQQIKDLKQLIFQAFLQVQQNDKHPQELGILVDEQYGKEIVDKANEKGIPVASGVEASGHDVLHFEYGRKFGKHVKKLDPDYVKVLVRYHPENPKGNKTQIKRLKKLSKFCKKVNKPLLLELLVPPTKEEKELDHYDTQIRPQKTAKAIKELEGKVDVAIWKLEGFSAKGWKAVLEALPQDAKVVVLGRGEDAQMVHFWLKEAAQFEQIIGFAIGRTIFMDPLLKLLKEEISEEAAKDQIAQNYKAFIDLWRNAKQESQESIESANSNEEEEKAA
ncbi:DUF2090 domain-containing protein [candidate division WWE3 bacterium]|nr:DUF2090 domain-containing protein [candidate division WWE3 bacterium]